jgi:hypothetical protein
MLRLIKPILILITVVNEKLKNTNNKICMNINLNELYCNNYIEYMKLYFKNYIFFL